MSATLAALVGAPALAATVLVAPVVPGLAAAASAAPVCADYTVIGAAGSGEGGEDGGLGPLVAGVADGFAASARAEGKTATVRAVHYPAAAVPQDISGIGPFLASIETGAADTQGDFGIVTRACPSTRVVLIGYSQGAAAVHRALQRLGDRPQIAAAALIADPDRLPGDTVISMGSARGGQGMARAAVVAGAVPGDLPPRIGAHTLSICTNGDPVCQWTGDLMSIGLNAHTSYTAGPILARLKPIAGL
ncbi:hypothetical protein GCM10023147_27170 [Tsukamurella soli]|uniref:Cutinase n=1 Tax=Tsukamurella soli TaxID=644556 RepID=A0ABP8JQX8_9ACTN